MKIVEQSITKKYYQQLLSYVSRFHFDKKFEKEDIVFLLETLDLKSFMITQPQV